MLWNFRKTSTTILPQLVFSRDGIDYDRRYREPFIAPGDEDDFDSMWPASRCGSWYRKSSWRDSMGFPGMGRMEKDKPWVAGCTRRGPAGFYC